MGTFHSLSVGANNHGITANPNDLGTSYADIAARDADTAFHSNLANVNKVVRVESPLDFFILSAVAPTWFEVAGSSSLSSVGTPVDNQVAIWTGPFAIEGDAALVFDMAVNTLTIGTGLLTNQPAHFNLDAWTAPTMDMFERVAATNTKGWRTSINSGVMTQSMLNEAESPIPYLTLTRVGMVMQTIAFTTPELSTSGNFTVTGDLTVSGTTTTLDTTTLLVEDKNIELGVVATPTDVTADGGGITLKGTTDKTLLWVNATDSWTLNQQLDMGNLKIVNLLDPTLAQDAATKNYVDSVSNGNVFKVGTPVDNQIGVWTGDGTLEGDVGLTFDTAINQFEVGSTVTGQSGSILLNGFLEATLIFDENGNANANERKWDITGSDPITFNLLSAGDVRTQFLSVSRSFAVVTNIAFSTPELITSGNLKTGDGTELLPAYSFVSDPDTGMRRVSADVLGFSAKGFDVLHLTAVPTANNFLKVTARENTISDDGVLIEAMGTETNVPIDIKGKGLAGVVNINVGPTGGTVALGRSSTSDGLAIFDADGGVAFGAFTTAVNTGGRVIQSIAESASFTKTETRIQSPNASQAFDFGINNAGVNNGDAFLTTSGTELIFNTSAGEALGISGLDVAITGALDMTSGLINNVLDPVSAQDAATKNYVDTSNVQGFVDTSGTPANNQVAIFVDADTVEGDADLLFDTSTNTLNVGAGVSGGSVLVVDAFILPRIEMREGDFPPNNRRWDTQVQAGKMTHNLLSDAGVAAKYIEITRGGNTANSIAFTTPALSTSGVLTVAGNLVVDTDTLFVDAANETVSIGATGNLADLTIEQNAVQAKRGVLLAGPGYHAGSGSADGVLISNLVNGAGNMQFGVGQFSDYGNATKCIFRLTTGIDVPNIGGVNGTGLTNKHINLGNPSSKVGIGHNTLSAVQADIIGQLDVMTGGTTNIGIISRGIVSQTADLFQARNSAQTVLTNIPATGGLNAVSSGADTASVASYQSLGTNAGISTKFVGDRDPNGNVTGAGGDEAYRDSAATSGTYESLELTTGTKWFKRTVNPPEIVEINTSAQFEALATAGVITVTGNLTLDMKTLVVTPTRFVVNSGGILRIVGSNRADIGFIYAAGAGTFITNSGTFEAHGDVILGVPTPAFGGKFIDATPTSVFDSVTMTNISMVNWQDLGSITGANAIIDFVSYVNVSGTWTFRDILVLVVTRNNWIGIPAVGPLYDFDSKIDGTVGFDEMAANVTAAGSVFNFSTKMNPNTRINMGSVRSLPGQLFKLSAVSDATISSVADGTIAAGTITAQSNNGSGGTTHASTTTYFENEEVTITGTTSYNGTFKVFNVVAGVSFDTITTFVANDAAGSVATERLALTLAGGHGIVAGDDLKIVGTNFYNGFVTALNVATNVLTVNGGFISTNTGTIERNLSVDQTDRRVFARNNFGFADSEQIACAHVNNNTTANGAIVNNTFTDMVFGTVASALIASSTMEGWKLVDELNGTLEYTDTQIFDGQITFDFTVESSGGTVDYRFKWQKDVGAGFVDLPDPVESLAAVGSDAQSVSKTFPLKMLRGDRLKPQITRNSGGSGITTNYATIYAKG